MLSMLAVAVYHGTSSVIVQYRVATYKSDRPTCAPRRSMKRSACLSPLCLSAAVILLIGVLHAQKDPGPRPVSNPRPAPSPFSTLNSTEKALFLAALARFQEVDSVSGTLAGERGVGL